MVEVEREQSRVTEYKKRLRRADVLSARFGKQHALPPLKRAGYA